MPRQRQNQGHGQFRSGVRGRAGLCELDLDAKLASRCDVERLAPCSRQDDQLHAPQPLEQLARHGRALAHQADHVEVGELARSVVQ